MRKLYIILAILCLGCSDNKEQSTKEEIQKELQELYEYGFSTKELSLRTYYTEEQIVDCIHGEQELPDTYYDRVKKIYQLYQEEGIIPINKLQKTSSECLWEVYTKTQNSLLLSQYTNIGISQVVNALTQRRSLSETDSLRALIAYVNMQYDIDTIPDKIVVSPYFYQGTKEGSIANIKVPQTYCSIINDPEKNKLAYYLWQAEQFELEANKRLDASLQHKMKQYATQISGDFVDDDIDSYINDIRNLFKNEKEVEQFYKEKLKDKLNLPALESKLKDEILSYCVSINSSRILLVNDLLNYNNFVNNLSIAESLKLQDFVVKTENLNRLITNRRINLAKDATVNAAGFAITSIGASGSLPTTGGTAGFVVGMMAWEGLAKVADDIDAMFRPESDIHIDEQMDTLKVKIEKQIEQSLLKQTQNENNYLEQLNENSSLFYNQIRKEFNIKQK